MMFAKAVNQQQRNEVPEGTAARRGSRNRRESTIFSDASAASFFSTGRAPKPGLADDHRDLGPANSAGIRARAGPLISILGATWRLTL